MESQEGLCHLNINNNSTNLEDERCPAHDAFGSSQQIDTNALRKLIIAISLCFIFMIAEIVGGYISNSLAVITDASHLLSDIAGFLISIFAITWSRKKASSSMSYGYHRAEILGALFSISLVWVMTLWLLIEAIERVRNPVEIDGAVMAIVALLGVVVNIIIGFVLHQPHNHSHHSHIHGHSHGHNHTEHHSQGENINIRAAFIHAMGDLIQSVGVLIAAIMIWMRPDWQIADPICTFIFCFLVIGSTLFLAKDTILILMEGTPKGFAPRILQRELADLDGVMHVHDLHVWSLAPGRSAATVHIVMDWSRQHQDPSFYESVLKKCQQVICKHNIHHVTIQIDPDNRLALHCRVDCCGSTDNFLSNPNYVLPLEPASR